MISFYLKAAIASWAEESFTFGSNIGPFPLEQVNNHLFAIAVRVVLADCYVHPAYGQ